MHFFLHARTRSVFAEITNKNKCNLFTRNCDARLHFFARINFVYLSICCCALFASLTWFFFFVLCMHASSCISGCVCVRVLSFFAFLSYMGFTFFFWSPDGGFPSACSSSDSSSLCPSLLLDVLWFGLSVGFTPVQMTSLTQKQYIDSFFFFLSGISDNSHFCTRGCLFFSPERCHVLIDRWIKNKKSNYLFIYLFSQKQNTGTPQCYRSPATKTGTAPSGKIKARKIAAAGKCVT